MPLHCLPSTRRQFIRRTVVGTLGVLTFRHLTAAAGGVEANRWALLSDTHIAGNTAEVRREINMAEHLRGVLAEIQAQPTRPEGLIINGDCALDMGLAEDYATFTDLLKPIANATIPLHLTLGNHDNREVFWGALREAAGLPRPVAGKQVSIIETARANWFLLDSLEITKQTPGRLGNEQQAWLGQVLDARRDKPALLMVHHNPIALDPAKQPGLLDAEQLLALALPRRHVKAIFFGHTHVWQLEQQDGLHLVNLPAVAYVFDKGQPSGWIDCKLAQERMSLELRALDTTHPAHGKVSELAWRT